MTFIDNLKNGYTGGHGVRLVLTIAGTDSKKNINNSLLEFKSKNPNITKDHYHITVYNFNPQSIVSNNKYGWGGVTKSTDTGENITKKNNNDTPDIPIYKQQLFVPKNTIKTLELKGNIYSNNQTWLDNALISKFEENDALTDFKNLKTIAEYGLCFLLTEYDPETMTSTNLEYWFIRNIEHTSEVFLYNNTPLKIGYTILLEKVNN